MSTSSTTKPHREITIDISDLDNLSGNAPLFCCSYNNEVYRAYVLLDEDGNVSADTRAPWDRATPIDEWHGRTRTWEIPAAARGDTLYAAFNSTYILELLQRIHDGHSVEWSGNNYIGILDDDAQDASDALQHHLDDLATWNVSSAADWLEQTIIDAALWPSGRTLEQVVADLKADASAIDWLIAGGTESIETALCEKLLIRLENDETFSLTGEQRDVLQKSHASRLANIEAERTESV